MSSPASRSSKGSFTRGAPLGSTARARPLAGYRHTERFRYGGFFTRYVGRDPLLDPEVASPGYEIFPYGLEAIFGADSGYFEDFYLHFDSELEAFVLGALAVL